MIYLFLVGIAFLAIAVFLFLKDTISGHSEDYTTAVWFFLCVVIGVICTAASGIWLAVKHVTIIP